MAKSKFLVWDCEPRFRLKCSVLWESLEATANGDVRHCRMCDKDVHLCRTPDDFVAHGEQGHCVAVPSNLGPGHMLGEPTNERVLKDKEDYDRGMAWWNAVARRGTSLDNERMEHIRAEQEGLALHFLMENPEYLAIRRLAAKSDGARCPHCGYDVAGDTFGVLIYLDTRRCEQCKEAFELDVASVETRPGSPD